VDKGMGMATADSHSGTDAIAWARGSFDALRSEVAALAASVARQQAVLDRVAQIDVDVVELASNLPDRLGAAIAAAVESRQKSFVAQVDEMATRLESVSASVREQARHAVETLEKAIRDSSTAAQTAADTGKRMHETSRSTAEQLLGLEELLSRLPHELRAGLAQTNEQMSTLSDEVTSAMAEVTGFLSRTDRTLALSIDQTEGGLAEVRAAINSVEERVGAATDIAERSATADDLNTLREITVKARDAAEAAAGREEVTQLADQVRNASAALGTVATAEELSSIATTLGRLQERLASWSPVERLDHIAGSIAELQQTLSEGNDGVAPLREAIGRIADGLVRTASSEDVERVRLEADTARQQLATTIETAVRDTISRAGVDEVLRAVSDLERRLEAGDSGGRVNSAIGELADSVTQLRSEIEALRRLPDAVDALPQRLAEPLAAVPDLVASVERLAESGGSGDRLDRIGQDLVAAIERQETVDGRAALAELEVRLGALTEQLAAIDSLSTSDHVDQRVDELVEMLATPIELDLADVVDRIVDAVGSGGGTVDLTPIEHRLDALAERLEVVAKLAARSARPTRTARKPQQADPES